MGLAMDSVGIDRLSGGAADTVFAAAVAAAGDSLQIRNGNQASKVYLERIMFQGIAGSQFRVRSPLLHDVAEGVQIIAGQTPIANGFGYYVRNELKPQDVLIAEMLVNAIAAHADGVLGIFYEDLPGAASRLHTWDDIANLIVTVKFLRVTMAAGGAAGAWLDTALTVTENLLHANTDYAVLGYIVDTPLAAVGIRGGDTANLRVTGPGVVDTKVTTEYFVDQSRAVNGPRIPVFNAANAGATFCSGFGNVSPTGANIQLAVAQLAHTV